MDINGAPVHSASMLHLILYPAIKIDKEITRQDSICDELPDPAPLPK